MNLSQAQAALAATVQTHEHLIAYAQNQCAAVKERNAAHRAAVAHAAQAFVEQISALFDAADAECESTTKLLVEEIRRAMGEQVEPTMPHVEDAPPLVVHEVPMGNLDTVLSPVPEDPELEQPARHFGRKRG